MIGVPFVVTLCILFWLHGAVRSRLYFRHPDGLVFKCSCGFKIILECPRWPNSKGVNTTCQGCGRGIDMLWTGSQFNLIGASQTTAMSDEEAAIRDGLSRGVEYPQEILEKYFKAQIILPGPTYSDGGEFSSYLAEPNDKPWVSGVGLGLDGKASFEAAKELRKIQGKEEDTKQSTEEHKKLWLNSQFP